MDAPDNSSILDRLLTPEEVAARITASSGMHVTGRTIWEKAKRLGIAKKVDRSPLISLDDVHLLLQPEIKSARGGGAIGPLELLHRARRRRERLTNG